MSALRNVPESLHLCARIAAGEESRRVKKKKTTKAHDTLVRPADSARSAERPF
jgi:hypothetical protein